MGSRRRPGRRPLAAALAVALLALLSTVPWSASAAADGNDAAGSPAPFRALSAGRFHTCAILGNGTVRCWGYNSNGQLGAGGTANRGDGVNEMGAYLTASDLGAGRTATAVSAGDAHTCAILDNATLRCWGANNAGQLSDSPTLVALGSGRTPVRVAAGASHTCAILDNGSLKCWGSNFYGQLGLGDTANRGDGAGEMGDNLPAVNLGTGRTATAVSASNNHTCALLDNGTVKCWGNGDTGQLGYGDTGQRGDANNEMGDHLPAVDLGTGRTATAISTGDFHTCAVLDNGSVKCWGYNFHGELGDGDTVQRGDGAGEMGDNLPAVNLGTGRTATAVAAGAYQTCALLDNARIKCWGSNTNGQLGYGDTAHRGDGAGEMGDNLPAVNLGTGRTATAVAVGSPHACATLDTGARKCWGANNFGQLGQEDTVGRGDGAGEMGDNLPVVFLPPAGIISGTITDSVSALPLANIVVAMLRTSDFKMAASALTDASGNYTSTVPPGTYFLYLLDLSIGHPDGFAGPPTTVTVTDGGTSDVDPTMVPLRGSFSGTVTDQGTGTPLGSVQVFAIANSGVAAGTTTAANGTYTLANLPAGTYRAVFIGGIGHRLVEYWDDSPDFAGSDPIVVAASTNTPNVNAALFRP